MKLYHVEPQAYGTFGSVVLAETPDRAKELFLEHAPDANKYKIKVTLLTDDCNTEYVSPEFFW